MRISRLFFFSLALAAAASPAAAQNDSDRGVENCRRNNGGKPRQGSQSSPGGASTAR